MAKLVRSRYYVASVVAAGAPLTWGQVSAQWSTHLGGMIWHMWIQQTAWHPGPLPTFTEPFVFLGQPSNNIVQTFKFHLNWHTLLYQVDCSSLFGHRTGKSS